MDNVTYYVTLPPRAPRLRGMNHPLPARMKALMGLMDLLLITAEATAKAARETYKERKRVRRGATIRPGPDTPLWNELMMAARVLLTRRGEKARLARILGVPRQRVHQYLRDATACPDAERTLLLLAWVHARRSGRDLL
jgi:hypothetical protein